MASHNAAAVAKEVLETVAKGGKVNHRSIALKHGYAPSVADNAYKITSTKTYQMIMKNAVSAMEKERARIITAMQNKDLDKEKYATLVQSMDTVTKNIQLLSGKSTENIAIKVEISEAVAKRNETKSGDSQEHKP